MDKIAETKSLPEWHPQWREPSRREMTEILVVTPRFAVAAWNWCDGEWVPRANIGLTRFHAIEPSAENRLAVLRETLVAIDEARPVLVSLIEAAERVADDATHARCL